MSTNSSLVFAFFVVLISSVDGRRILSKDLNGEAIDPSNVTAASLATGATNQNDVVGLMILVGTFFQLYEVVDDPCFAPKLSWIECNSDPNPRVIALNLRDKKLAGILPDFSIMTALQTIDLSENALIGSIPLFLGNFADLQILNLADNGFSGVVPNSLSCKKDLNLILRGNPDLDKSNSCSTSSNNNNNNVVPSPWRDNDSSNNAGVDFDVPTKRSKPKKKNNRLAIILGTVIPAFVALWIAVGVFAIRHHKAKSAVAVAEVAANSEVKNMPAEEMPIKTTAGNNITSP
ncbi:putative leucine-rich repeat receptor-like serine/threonine-protein kinase At2g19230 isoform X1 [Andrographis paniculata]|uniref:putative leucine-rich repeat receptor-like serine/threonine-protein kinase At2g19230 isoform X1 n=1 Tax=Andrographis paniculata TaxID=175694 RepID=UPI0021E81F3D|nr:putative leucine-rich repeat receptor-like serine/threonine-protein kinase At2g19230 isoform X1 [Andrographis paniculata]